MKINKPNFWQDPKSFVSLFLLHVTFFVTIFIFLKKKISNEKKFKIPILCIGNIYIGGTGKTPLSIFIAEELKYLRKKPVIIKKFYADHKDERLLIKRRNLPLISEKYRENSLSSAEKKYDLAILDDGFQDYKIKKNMSILCFHSKQLIGNGKIFPSGPLRESLNAVTRAQIAIINGNKSEKFENKLLNINSNLQIIYSKYKLTNKEKFNNKNILAFAGIGNPNNFFDLLKSNGLTVKKTLSFPDHYNFKKSEILKIINIAKKENYTILTTEKDFLRIEKHKFSEINYCEVELEVLEKEKLIESIKKIYD